MAFRQENKPIACAPWLVTPEHTDTWRHTKLSAAGSTKEAEQSLHDGKQDCSAVVSAEPRQEEAAEETASGTEAKLVYLQVKGTKSRSQMVASSVCLFKGNGLLLHHKQAEQSKSTAPSSV